MSLNTVEEKVELNTETGSVDTGVLSSLGINTQLFVFQFINFAIVVGILWFLILKPLVKKMEERKKQVDESVDNAKAIATAMQMSEKKYQEKIDEAKVAANRIMAKAHDESGIISKQIKEKAQKDIELLVLQAKKNIEIDKRGMKDELRKETVGIVVMAMEKLLAKKFSGKDNEKFIADILKSLNK